ncbi:MAG: hypothetical protein M0R44_02735 [Candidatus Marinimicrobia bacterium]|nr:hypothetical protein [Candidatus Neomarinimicrobiota bacterium]
MRKKYLRTGMLLLPIAQFWWACAPMTARFDPVAYERTISLKVETLALMAKADEPFDQHAEAVAALQKELEKAYEAAKGRPRNDYTTLQWQIIKNPRGNLVGGFFRHWQEKGALSPVMVAESSKLIADAFDQIIGLEGGKIKPGK